MRALLRSLLPFSRLVDTLNAAIGRSIGWLILAAVLVSAGNAGIRKAFDMSSNAYLELQWYLFSAVFLLGAGYTLLHQEHIRIDLLYGRFTRRTQICIDIFGTLCFLLPLCLLMLVLSWPFFMHSWLAQETSANAGGLLLWPVKALLPLGFLLLLLQGLSELIKRCAFLYNLAADPGIKAATPEQEIARLAAQIQAQNTTGAPRP